MTRIGVGVVLAALSVTPRAGAPASRAAPAPEVAAAPLPAETLPRDVTVDAMRHAENRIRLTLQRRGHLVALRSGSQVSAADDRVSAQVEGLVGRDAELVWEATDPATLATIRGSIRVAPGADKPQVVLSSLPPPTEIAASRDRLHTCLAHTDGGGGFTVLCRLDSSARQVSVVNVSGDRPEGDVWASPHRSRLVRLDLPMTEGDTQARILTYLHEASGIVVRAEASWARGEKSATFALLSSVRRQPVASSPSRPFDVLR